MMRSLFSAVSGLKNHQTAMDVIGNNVSNVNTTGYKSSRVVFQDVYSQTISSATASTTTTGGSNAKQVGLGVSIATIGLNMCEGSTQSTSNTLDFAISGEGFFVVDDGNGGYFYTRNGSLALDDNGYLVTANGDYVMGVPTNPPVGVPTTVGDTVVICTYDADGELVNDATKLFEKIRVVGTVVDASGTTTYSGYAVDSNGVITANATKTDTAIPPVTTSAVKTIGRLILATFNNTGGLEKSGSSYYSEGSNSGDAVYNFANLKCGKLKSGNLEMSNVDLATELTNMIIMQRGFQANSRVITTSDTLLEELINLKR